MPDRLISGSTDPNCIATVANNYSTVSLEEFTSKLKVWTGKKEKNYLPCLFFNSIFLIIYIKNINVS